MNDVIVGPLVDWREGVVPVSCVPRVWLVWLLLLALPWQAQMAVRMDLHGPAHHHGAGAVTPNGATDAHLDRTALLLPRDFVAGPSSLPAHDHGSTRRHWHGAEQASVAILDVPTDDGGGDWSGGGFGSMFAAAPTPAFRVLPVFQVGRARATAADAWRTRDPVPPRRPPIAVIPA